MIRKLYEADLFEFPLLAVMESFAYGRYVQ